MNETILSVLQHALGVNEFGRGPQYRNYYVCGEGHHGYTVCCDAVEQGLMARRESNILGGNGSYFHATDAGRRWMAENSPTPPKLTRSQARYQRFLDADSGLTFREWLRTCFADDAYVAALPF